jgi:hypothetical protein
VGKPTKTSATPPRGGSNVVPFPGGRHGRPDQPWQHGDPRGGFTDISDALHWSGYAAPYIIGAIILPVWGVLPRLLFGQSRGLLITGAMLFLVLGIALTYAAWDESRPRRPYQRRRAAVTILWVFLAAAGTHLVSEPLDYGWWGPGSWWGIVPRWWLAEVLVGLVLAVWWTIGSLPAVKGDGQDQHAAGPDLLAEALGLGQTHPRGEVEMTQDGIRRTVPLRLKGVTIEALRAATGLIAVKARAPRGGVRVIEDPRDASAPDLVILTKDVLRDMPEPPGPSRPGGSITEPLRVGLHEDFTQCESTRVEEGFGGKHIIVGGRTGSGKSTGWREETFEIVTRVNVVLLHADIRKLASTFPDVAPAFARVASTVAGAKKLCRGLIGAVEYRTEQVGLVWTTESRDHLGNRMPAVGVSFEEAAAYANELGTTLREAVETLRSVGFFVTLSMQRPAGELLDTNTRSQFGEGWCFPVSKDEDVVMILNEETIEGGATPTAWGSKLPEFSGYNYRECDDSSKHSMPTRCYNRDPRKLREHVAYWAPRMAWGQGPEGLDAGTAEAMGEAWTDLTSGADYALAHGWTRTPEGLWAPPRELGQTQKDVPPVTQPAYGTPGPVVQKPPSLVQDHPEPDPEEENPETDRLTPEEIMETEDDMKDARDEVLEEIMEDEEITEDPDPEGDHVPPEWNEEDAPVGEDIDLEPGELTADGRELGFRERVLAAADVIEKITGGKRKTVRTSVLVDAWFEVPGITSSQRPALNRLLVKLVAAGEAEDPGRGRWTLEPTAPGWLRRHAEELVASADSDEDEEDDEA